MFGRFGNLPIPLAHGFGNPLERILCNVFGRFVSLPKCIQYFYTINPPEYVLFAFFCKVELPNHSDGKTLGYASVLLFFRPIYWLFMEAFLMKQKGNGAYLCKMRLYIEKICMKYAKITMLTWKRSLVVFPNIPCYFPKLPLLIFSNISFYVFNSSNYGFWGYFLFWIPSFFEHDFLI